MDSNNLYNSHNLAIKIKEVAKLKNIIIKNMLSECNLGSNTMSALYHGKSIAFDSLATIADYLNCSVDYLLGRIDNVEGEGFTEKEKRLITEYRNKPEMQGAIDRLLDLNDLKVIEPKENVGRIAAFGSGPKEISINDDTLREANELPDA